MDKDKILRVLQNTTKSLSFATSVQGIELPFLPLLSLPITFEPSETDLSTVAECVESLCKWPHDKHRAELEEAIYAECLQSFEDCELDFETPQKQLDWEVESTGKFDDPKVPEHAKDIWSLVKFTEIRVANRQWYYGEDPLILTSVCADCAWDGEHGVALHYGAGKRFIGVRDLNA